MKRFLSLIIILVLLFSMTSIVSAADAITDSTVSVKTTLDRANALKDMGLFAGTNTGYNLEGLPTRAQAITFLLRTLGEEEIAQNSDYTCPFTDVPSWAYKSVSYAYNKGYTSGTGKTTFGANDLSTPAHFVTFMLRALGYNDKEGDFVWSESVQKAESLGIFSSGKYTANGSFNRGDCVDIIYSVLGANKKGETTTLAESLIAKEAINGTTAAKYGFSKPTNLVDLSSKTFTTNERLSILSAKSLHNDYASIMLEIVSPGNQLKATNVYISEDGINYEVLKMNPKLDNSNDQQPSVWVDKSFYNIINLEFSTTYTVCFETSPNVLMTPVTIKTADAKAASVSGYGSPYRSSSTDGISTIFEVGLNISIEGNWSYQFYRWTPGSDPVAISGASGVANGSAEIFYEPTSEDLNSIIFWRVTNDDGIIIENPGKSIDYITGMQFR